MSEGKPGAPATIVGAGLVALDLLVLSLPSSLFWQRAGGTCGNVLAILSFLGFKSVPIARLGTENAAGALISDLESLGVDCHHIHRDPNATTPGVVEFIPARSGGTHRFAFSCPVCHRRLPRRSEPIWETAVESFREIGAIQLFFFDRPGTTIVRLAHEARERGAVVMFEPDSFKFNDHFTSALKVSDIVKYSERGVGKSIDPWLNETSARPRLVIETLDGGGLRYMLRTRRNASATWKHQRAYRMDTPADQAGAGDWCSAGLIARLLTNGSPARWREKTIVRALAFGQALAAASIGFKGPRGYLENVSLPLVRRAALSTLRLGRVPDWVIQDRERSAWSVSQDGRHGACPLCLAPVPQAPGYQSRTSDVGSAST
jgi:fructokinase